MRETTGHQEIAVPQVGTMARDITRGKIGQVMAHQLGRVWLRPPNGGREWDVSPDQIQLITTSELLSPRVAEANQQSWERGCGT